jgi:glycosidase
MWGADDPTCRKPMLWKDLEPYAEPEENHVMADHLAFYREVIALRNAHPALRVGTFRTVLTDDEADVWAFVRSTDDETLLVALNNSDQRQAVTIPIADGSAADAWRGVFGFDGRVRTADGGVTVTVPPVAGVVLKALP